MDSRHFSLYHWPLPNGTKNLTDFSVANASYNMFNKLDILAVLRGNYCKLFIGEGEYRVTAISAPSIIWTFFMRFSPSLRKAISYR
jgi:hypothetical protein